MKYNILYILLFILIILFIIIYQNWYNLQINLIVFLIVNRGLIAPNCTWWNISSRIMNDPSGINLYYKLKNQYGDMIPINILGSHMYLVTDINSIRQVLNNSPDTFCVGKFKYNFFKPFMKLNVGVNSKCLWKRTRHLNEKVLMTNHLHLYSSYYNKIISQYLENHTPTNFNDFVNASQHIISKVVFNREMIPNQIFQIFPMANSLQSVVTPNFELPEDINQFYRNFIWQELQNPRPNSLVDLCQNSNLKKDELIDQVPHWIFPIGGIIHTVVPRTLVMLCNHPRIFQKLIHQINQININSATQIHNLKYLKYCILEALRLNNLVTSTFRTLCKDFTFQDGSFFPKDTQFLILNNPVLRDESCFPQPNQYIPERWNDQLEDMYCNLTFNQGPQKCPGKDLSLFIIESFIVHYLKNSNLLSQTKSLQSQKINVNNMPQMINPCSITFNFESL